MKLSVVVICENEQDRIKACLESVKWAEELIIVDNGSTDSTLEIAEKYTDNILTFKDLDFAHLRNKAVEKSEGEWVLYVDADERVLQALKEEIQSLINNNERSSPSDKSAYAISRKNIIFGKEVSYGPYKKDWVIRLLKKSDFDKWVGEVHEQPNFRGELGYTKNSLLHLTHRDLDQIVLKSLEWSQIDAKLRLQSNHPEMSGWRFLRIFVTEIWNQGIVRRGFFNGTVGVMDSLLQVFSMVMSYIRLWQLQQPTPLDEVYQDLDKRLIENNFKDS